MGLSPSRTCPTHPAAPRAGHPCTPSPTAGPPGRSAPGPEAARPKAARSFPGRVGSADAQTDGRTAALLPSTLLARCKSTGMEGARAEAELPRAARVLEAKAPGGQGKGTGLGGQQRWGGTGQGKQERSQHRAPTTWPSRCPLQGKCWETWASGRLEIN